MKILFQFFAKIKFQMILHLQLDIFCHLEFCHFEFCYFKFFHNRKKAKFVGAKCLTWRGINAGEIYPSLWQKISMAKWIFLPFQFYRNRKKLLQDKFVGAQCFTWRGINAVEILWHLKFAETQTRPDAAFKHKDPRFPNECEIHIKSQCL